MKIKKLLVLILTLLVCVSFCACGEDGIYATDDAQSKNEATIKPTRFTVTVVDQDGNVVEGVILKLHKSSNVTARTNNNGVATFPMIVTDGYRLSVFSCPKGYECVGLSNINITAGTSEYILKITKK